MARVWGDPKLCASPQVEPALKICWLVLFNIPWAGYEW